MFGAGTKFYGYVFENNEWLRFSKFNIPEDKAQYNLWHEKYKKRIHVSRSKDSPLIFYKPKHGTFTLYSVKDFQNEDSVYKPMTYSHYFRQKVLSEMTELNFEIYTVNNKNRRFRKKHLDFKINADRVLVEENIYNKEGQKKRPDLVIEFESPVSQAIKWGGKIFVEIVETNDVDGSKTKFYNENNHPIIVIPPSSHFNYLKKKPIDITEDDINGLENKIKNFYRIKIHAILLLNVQTKEYKERIINNHFSKKCDVLQSEIKVLNSKISELNSELSYNKNVISDHLNQIDLFKREIKSLKTIISKKVQKITTLNDDKEKWNNKPLFSKFLSGFKHE